MDDAINAGDESDRVLAVWRLAVRDVLGGLLRRGGRVTGFHDRSYYVVECHDSEGSSGAGRVSP